jgi:hypothetical protein
MVHVGLQPQTEPFRVVNLVHRAPLEVARLFAFIRDRGYASQAVPLAQWVDDCQAFIRRHYSKKQAFVLKYLFREESTGYLFQWYFRPYRFITHHMTEALSGSGIELPPLDKTLWDTYFDRLIADGLLPAAEKSTRADLPGDAESIDRQSPIS